MMRRLSFGGSALAAVLACAPTAVTSARCDATDVRCADVGYGMRAQRRTTGAVTSYVVQPGDAAGIARVEQLMEGRFAGLDIVRVGGDFSIRIRGTMAQNNRGEPLVVVDGIPAPVGLAPAQVLGAVVPATVLRIDVLKDIGATSAYGARGVNGVILITTRR